MIPQNPGVHTASFATKFFTISVMSRISSSSLSQTLPSQVLPQEALQHPSFNPYTLHHNDITAATPESKANLLNDCFTLCFNTSSPPLSNPTPHSLLLLPHLTCIALSPDEILLVFLLTLPLGLMASQLLCLGTPLTPSPLLLLLFLIFRSLHVFFPSTGKTLTPSQFQKKNLSLKLSSHLPSSKVKFMNVIFYVFLYFS